MTDIVITEFLEPSALEVLKKDFTVHWDRELWNKRSELEKLVRDLPGLIVRNRTPVDKALLDLAPKLKVVGRLGVGLDRHVTTSMRSPRMLSKGLSSWTE